MSDQPIGRPPTAAEEERTRAQTAAITQQIRNLESENREQEMKNRIGEITLEREEFKRSQELATDEYHRVYRFDGEVTGQSVKACMKQLSLWERIDPKCDIEIVFFSPGGDIVAGMALFDYIQSLRRNGHYVVTSAIGMAASMAGILLQSGDKRVMTKESWLLIHQGSFGAMGSFGDVEDRVEWVKKIQDRILNIFAARAKLSKEEIDKRWERKNWWISSDEALEWGFIDEIA